MFPDQEPCVKDFTTRCDGCISSWSLLHTALDQGTTPHTKNPGGGRFLRSTLKQVSSCIIGASWLRTEAITCALGSCWLLGPSCRFAVLSHCGSNSANTKGQRDRGAEGRIGGGTGGRRGGGTVGWRVRMRGWGLGSRPKKMYGERLGDGVEYHLMKPTPRR